MKKHIFYFISILLMTATFASCSKEDDCDPSDEDSPCYAGVGSGAILLLTEQKINGEIVAQFEYDNQNRRVSYILVSGTIEYQYGNKGLHSATIYKDKGGKITHREDYSFGPDDRPVSMVISNPNKPDDIPIDVQYTYSKNKIVTTSIPREDNADISTFTYNFNEQGNLMLVVTSTNGWEHTANAFSAFDDKRAVDFHGHPNPWMRSKNNAQRFQVTSAVYNLDQKWVYTYNKEGYPTKALVYNDGSDVAVEEHLFSYKAAQ